MQIEGTTLPTWLLRVEEQPEVGTSGYDAGAKILNAFFRKELASYLHPELDSAGRQIIQCCLDGGSVADYEKFMPSMDFVGYGQRGGMKK